MNTTINFRNFIRKYLFSNYGLICLLVLAWHLTLLVIGEIGESLIPFANSNHVPQGIFSHTWRWDGGWYTSIIQEAYADRPGQTAFYPLFPLITYTFHLLTFKAVPIIASGVLVNVLASCFAAIGLYKIALHHLKDDRLAWSAVILFLSFPTAIFMHFFYTEAIFCALGFWAYYFALKRKWWAMALFLAFLSATRITALLFIGLCGLEYLRARHWKVRQIDKNILWFAIAPFGFLAYATYLHFVGRSFFSMFTAYEEVTDWNYQVFNPNFLETYANEFVRAIQIMTGDIPLDEVSFANILMPVAALLLMVLICLYGLLKLRGWTIPLSIFGLVSFIFFTLNSNVVSAHRYTLPVIAIYLIPLAAVNKSRRLLPIAWVFAGFMAMTQVLLLVLFVSWRFVG